MDKLQNRKSMNLRDAQMTGKEGMNPTENPGLMPGATEMTSAEKAENVTEQYWGGMGAGSGPWGGEAKDE